MIFKQFPIFWYVPIFALEKQSSMCLYPQKYLPTSEERNVPRSFFIFLNTTRFYISTNYLVTVEELRFY